MLLTLFQSNQEVVPIGGFKINIPLKDGILTIPNNYIKLIDLVGIGNPKPRVSKHIYTNDHGGIFLSQFYDIRRLSLSVVINAPDALIYQRTRDVLSEAFYFENAEKEIEIISDTYALSVKTMIADAVKDTRMGPVTSGHIIELDAFDPYLYSNTTQTVTGKVVTSQGSGFSLPFSLPLSLPGSVMGLTTIANNGNINSYIQEARIIGPLSGFVYSNNTTGKSLYFNGDLMAGEELLINMKEKTAYIGTLNVFHLISGDWWDLVKGVNTIGFVAGSNYTDQTSYTLTTQDVYIGR